MTDPIVDEVRAIRAQIAADCGYDLNRIADSAKAAAARVPGLTYVSIDELRRSQLEPDELSLASANDQPDR